MTPLTSGEAHGTLTPVSTQKVLVRVRSRETFAVQARSGFIPARFFMGGRIGGLRPAGSARVPRSSNPVLPAHPFRSGWSGSSKEPLTMSDHASGDATPRANPDTPQYDPASGLGYFLCEDDHLDLQMLASALMALSALTEPSPEDIGVDVDPGQLAPLFFTLGRTAERLAQGLTFAIWPPEATPAPAPASQGSTH